jgi:O-methyltransferase
VLIQTIPKFIADEWRYRRIASKYRPWTMIPLPTYVSNLRLAARIEGVSGSVVECGTWRGGMIAGIADVLGGARRYYLFDSFEGLPPAREVDGAEALAWQANPSAPEYYDNCTASEDEARAAMSKSSARDYRIFKGWFESTLPKMDPGEKIALLRMDADWYDSTKCILDNFAERVVPGGIVIVDDYYAWEGCAVAVNEYAAAHKWRIQQSRYGGVCFVQL